MKSKKEPAFEEQMRRLEDIVEILDRGEEPLDQLLKYFEEGMALSRNLRQFLEKAEQKVIDVSRQNDAETMTSFVDEKLDDALEDGFLNL